MSNSKWNKNKHSILQAKVRRPDSRYNGIHQFRGTVDDSEYFRAYRLLFPLKASLQDYHGSPFPKKAVQIFGNKAPKNAVSAFREILWSIARCQLFAESLKQFVVQKEVFERAILQSQFDKAVAELDKIEDSFGKSVWMYQNRIASAHISSNEGTPSEMAALVLEEVKINPILHPLMHYIRRRIEGASLPEKLLAEIGEFVQPETLFNYFRAKTLDFSDSSEKAVASLLFFDSQASLIDHYTSLVLTLQAATSDRTLTKEMHAHILPPLAKLHEETNDRRLLGVLVALGRPSKNAWEFDPVRANALEAYTLGNYTECCDLAERVLKAEPLDSAIRLLRVKAEVAGQIPMQTEPGLSGEIHTHLFNLLSANMDFFPSAHALLVLSNRYSDHQSMLYLKAAAWYEMGAEDDSRTPMWMRDMYVRDFVATPFLALTLEPRQSQLVVGELLKSNAYPATLALVSEILSDAEIEPESINPRLARYVARERLSKRRFVEAAYLYGYAAVSEKRHAVRLRALGGKALALMLDGQFQSALDTVINAFLESPNAPTLLPFREMVGLLPDADLWPNTINLGLLLNLASQFDLDDDISKLRLAFEKFCEVNAITRPSELAEETDRFGLPNIIAFLDHVWQPEVMRQTLLYMSPEEIEEARIEACQVLVKIDVVKARAHKEELASRIKQQEIAKTTALVEKSKVYVDIEAIKRSLRNKLKPSYTQYKNSISLHGKHPNALLQKIQAALEGLDASTSLPTLLSSLHFVEGQEHLTQSDIQFDALFAEITKEFLTGDHGLNAYLSTRVRHGKLVDALRKSVADEHLMTARLDDGTYVPNVFWDSQLTDTSRRTAIVDALSKFCVKLDTTLFHVRDKRIQIRTYYDLKALDENTEGLFVYQFSNLERKLMESYDTDFKDFDELIVKCVDSLWEKTDSNLVLVREFLSDRLRAEVIKHFDELAANLTVICDGLLPSGLSNAIARSRTATQQALDQVVAWFVRSEVYDRQDFDIDFPGQIAASMVHRTLSVQSDWLGPEYGTMEADTKLPGRSLDTLVDIFYALFENAVKYAELELVPLKVRVSAKFEKGEFSAIVVSDVKEPTDARLVELESLRASLANQESRRLAQTEGRSGFRKILLALSSPLYKNPSLEFDHDRAGLFKVLFRFRISEAL